MVQMDKRLKKIREKIDAIDREIMGLLNKRMELSARSRELKDKTADPGREGEVFSNVEHLSYPFVDAGFSKRLYREIIDESRRVQEGKTFKIPARREKGLK